MYISTNSSANTQYTPAGYFLLFDENISNVETTNGALLFIMILMVLYILLLFWAKRKDKEPFDTNNQIQKLNNITKIQSSLVLMPEDLIISNETLGPSTLSQDSDRLPESFGAYPHKLESKTQSIPPLYTINEEEEKKMELHELNSDENKNSTAIEMIDITTQEKYIETGANETINLDMSDSSFFGTKMAEEDRLRRRTTSTKKHNEKNRISNPIKKKQTIKSKFPKLLQQRNPIVSTIYINSILSPRSKRITLVYFALISDFFGCTIIFIDKKLKYGNIFFNLIVVNCISWTIVLLMMYLSSVSREKLKFSKSFEDFQQYIKEIEREAICKKIIIYILVTLACSLAFSQFSLFISIYSSDTIKTWIIISTLSFIFQFLIGDVIWIFCLSLIYTRAYESRYLRKFYRFIGKLRCWRL